MKKVVISTDSFKGSFSGVEATQIIQKALSEKYGNIHTELIPVADGGEGTLDTFLCAVKGERISCRVKSPLGREIRADFGIFEKNKAIVEMAQASGLNIDREKSPMRASSFGTGQLIASALGRGVREIYLAIGGSATTDCGIGMLSALGVAFCDIEGRQLEPVPENLEKIARIDRSGLMNEVKACRFVVLCDVKNPLYGKEGAAMVYARQKGADENQIRLLDKGLRAFSEVCKESFRRDFSFMEGAGAAGGVGFAAALFLNAEIQRGIDVILKLSDFRKRTEGADLIITGEGKLDSQSLMGKVPFGVLAESGNIPVVALVGLCTLSDEEKRASGFYDIIEANPEHLPFEEIKHNCRSMLYKACKKITL